MRRIMALLALMAISLATGCGTGSSAPIPSPAPTQASPAASQPAATPQSAIASAVSYPLTITDDAGRQVTIKKKPQRIVSIASSNTEILYALGLGARIVGLDQYSDYPPEVKDKPRVGGYSKPDLEKIVLLEPDLVLATGIHVKATVPELEKRDFPTVVVDPRDVQGVVAKVELLGRVTDTQAEAATLVDQMRSRVRAVESRVAGAAPVRVFYELSPELHTAGPGSFVDDLIRLAGGTNIAAGAGKEWPQLNQEAVLLADPEVVILGDHTAGETPETVSARSGWKDISAVKNGRIHAIDPNLANRPGPRVVEGLELIAGFLHPQKPR